MSMNLAHINAELGRNAQGLVDWAVGLNQRAIVTTNFRPFEAKFCVDVCKVHAHFMP